MIRGWLGYLSVPLVFAVCLLFFFSFPSHQSAVTTMASPISYDPENVFLKIVQGKIPSYKLFETEDVLAILDAFPTTRGHSLLIPKATGYATLEDMPPEIAAKVFYHLPRLAKAVRAATGAQGVNVVVNNGAAAGQAVFHLHIHVIPRFDADNLLKFPPSGGMISKETGAELAGSIQQHLGQ